MKKPLVIVVAVVCASLRAYAGEVSYPDSSRVYFKGGIRLAALTAATLPTVNIPNGTVVYCADCAVGTNPCATGGNSGTLAFKITGAWSCGDLGTANVFGPQQRFLANYLGLAGGIDIDATNLINGVGLIIENNRSSPIGTDPLGQGWIVLDGDSNSTAPFTGQPSFVLEAHANGTDPNIQADPVLVLRRSRGTHGAPTVVGPGTNTQILGSFIFQGYDGQANPWNASVGGTPQGGVASIEAYAGETFSAAQHGSTMAFYSIPIASTVCVGAGNPLTCCTGVNTGTCGLTDFLRSTSSGYAWMRRLKVGNNTASDPAVQLDVSGNFAVTGGVSASTGIAHKRKGSAGCTTGAAIGAVCSDTITWPTALGDANYSVVCLCDGVTQGFPVIGTITAKVSASVTVQTMAGTAAVAQCSNIDCMAFHD